MSNALTNQRIIPGSESWPEFIQNDSNQFEARLVRVKIKKIILFFCIKWQDQFCHDSLTWEGKVRYSNKKKKDAES
ncbi:MAG: hypothetical protein Ct9H90mP18_01350 [Gammaproteobacteria bacterium]|nr:MAG: hypothetical protein Ct9H90mP18_01350 [Gammaproteobacteria bacterium]